MGGQFDELDRFISGWTLLESGYESDNEPYSSISYRGI